MSQRSRIKQLERRARRSPLLAQSDADRAAIDDMRFARALFAADRAGDIPSPEEAPPAPDPADVARHPWLAEVMQPRTPGTRKADR